MTSVDDSAVFSTGESTNTTPTNIEGLSTDDFTKNCSIYRSDDIFNLNPFFISQEVHDAVVLHFSIAPSEVIEVILKGEDWLFNGEFTTLYMTAVCNFNTHIESYNYPTPFCQFVEDCSCSEQVFFFQFFKASNEFNAVMKRLQLMFKSMREK